MGTMAKSTARVARRRSNTGNNIIIHTLPPSPPLLPTPLSPAGIFLARGNHESRSMNKIYGFDGEVKSKCGEKMIELFADLFCCLPLAHVINSRIFIVHGGLFSKDGVTLDDIRAINRFQEPPDEGEACFLVQE